MIRRFAGWLIALIVVSAGVYFVMQAAYQQRPAKDLTPTGLAPPEQAAPPPVSRSRVDRGNVPRLDQAWVSRTARRAGLPEPALTAYARAMLMAPGDCEVGWTTLAGIGWVESQHGTIGGRSLGVDGHSSSPILGPALDGRGKFAAIPATPQTTAWHGDVDWDHAVGPMQFIPSTWEAWGADGDGDGVSDPNDLDDAAYAAVGYLCADGRDLATSTGWSGGVFSYNHSDDYVAAVHAAAQAYADRTLS